MSTTDLRNLATIAGSVAGNKITVEEGLEETADLIDGIDALLNDNDLLVSDYTPTLVHSINITASTAQLLNYFKLGSIVVVFGEVTIQAAGSGATRIYMSVPIASNFSTARQVGGSGASSSGNALRIISDPTGDRIQIDYQSTTSANLGFFFILGYKII